MKIHEVIIILLQRLGITAVFGIPGSSSPFFQDVHLAGLKPVLTKHEIGAGWMAIGHYLHTKKIPLLLCSRGPGIVQAIPTIAAAKNDCIPLVVLSTCIARNIDGGMCFQDYSGIAWSVSQFDICSVSAKVAVSIKKASDILKLIPSAWTKMKEYPRGPMYVEVDESILNQEYYGPIVALDTLNNFGRPALPNYNLLEALEHVRNLARPLFLLGAGVMDCRVYDLMNDIVAGLGACVTTTLKAKGCLPHDCLYNFGVLGKCGNDSANQLVRQCDGFVAIGTSLNEMTLAPTLIDEIVSRGGKFIWVNIPCHTHLLSHITVNRYECDAIEFLQALATKCRTGRRSPWKQCAETRESRDIWHSLACCTESRKVYFVESLIQTAQNLKIDHRSEFHAITNSASLGCALPAAIGAAFENKQNTVYFAITGDAGFQMSAMELMTAVNYKVKIICIVLVNGVLGPISRSYRLKGLPQVACTFKNPSFLALGKAFGLSAWHARDGKEFEQYLKLSLLETQSCIIAVESD